MVGKTIKSLIEIKGNFTQKRIVGDNGRGRLYKDLFS